MKALAWLAPLAALTLTTGCEPSQTEMAPEAPGAAAPELVMVIPITTESEDARAEFEAGMHAQDMARTEANEYFERAVAADPEFATGYLMAALSAPSTEEFAANLARANEYSQGASQAEQLLIRITQKGFENDREGQLAAARELVDVQPESPRAWLALAGVQAGLNQVEASRTSIARAIEMAPDFAAAHMQLGNNYLFLDPKDFDMAERHFRRAAELAPEEPNPHDLLGDVHRAQGNLEAAYEDYTRAAELAPDMGSPLQQRGHVNSFLGHYDEARADYDRAMELETAKGNNLAPYYAVFRAYVNLHAGEPAAAISELQELVSAADQMDVEGRADIKVNALTNIAQIAMHYGDFETAVAALADRAVLVRGQADEVGTEQFRRATEAGIVYFDGMVAARRGDAAEARAKAEEYGRLVEPDPNPRKMEPVHQLLGITEFFQENYAAAAEQLAQSAPGNVYMKYYLGVALAESGREAEAQRIFDELAVYNFNGVGYAMTRADVLARSQQTPAKA